MKRVRWFLTGITAGLIGQTYLKSKLKDRSVGRVVNVFAQRAERKLISSSQKVRQALQDGKDAKKQKEIQLKAKINSGK